MLSRNKVAVPEGVAGTPPFWSLTLQKGLIELNALFSFFIKILSAAKSGELLALSGKSGSNTAGRLTKHKQSRSSVG